jgi:hypothetical protein
MYTDVRCSTIVLTCFVRIKFVRNVQTKIHKCSSPSYFRVYVVITTKYHNTIFLFEEKHIRKKCLLEQSIFVITKFCLLEQSFVCTSKVLFAITKFCLL